MEAKNHPIFHYVDGETPNAGTQVHFSVKVKGPAAPGKGFFYYIENTSDRFATAIVQMTDVIRQARSWEVVSLGPGGTHDLGYDRPDGDVYRQWYFWTTTTDRQGAKPWYPQPTVDTAYGSLAVLEQGSTWFLVNRDTFNFCHVSWESNLSFQEETIDQGSIALGDVATGSGHRLDVVSASLIAPTHPQPSVEEAGRGLSDSTQADHDSRSR